MSGGHPFDPAGARFSAAQLRDSMGSAARGMGVKPTSIHSKHHNCRLVRRVLEDLRRDHKRSRTQGLSRAKALKTGIDASAHKRERDEVSKRLDVILKTCSQLRGGVKNELSRRLFRQESDHLHIAAWRDIANMFTKRISDAEIRDVLCDSVKDNCCTAESADQQGQGECL